MYPTTLPTHRTQTRKPSRQPTQKFLAPLSTQYSEKVSLLVPMQKWTHILYWCVRDKICLPTFANHIPLTTECKNLNCIFLTRYSPVPNLTHRQMESHASIVTWSKVFGKSNHPVAEVYALLVPLQYIKTLSELRWKSVEWPYETCWCTLNQNVGITSQTN